MIPPWLNSSFYLLVHGELHYTLQEDFDRRLSLISFDNAIEASIACYLKLDPTQRGNRPYQRERVRIALEGNYHHKLDFLFEEITNRSGICTYTRQEIIFVHNQRGHFYHESPDFIPSNDTLALARAAAFWIFVFLFEVPDLESEVIAKIKQIRKVEDLYPRDNIIDLYPRNKDIDELIDTEYPEIEILGIPYKPSEVLYAVDPIYYRAFVEDILGTEK
jgi:hypothetical protein